MNPSSIDKQQQQIEESTTTTPGITSMDTNIQSASSPSSTSYRQYPVPCIHQNMIMNEPQLETQDTMKSTVLTISGIIILLAYVAFGFSGGLQSIILLTLSLFPVVIILSFVTYYHAADTSAALFAEMFWSGAVLSILIAYVLEFFVEKNTWLIWECQALAPSPSCDIRFVFVLIIGVGLVEEFAKFIPLSRLRLRQYPQQSYHTWWFRRLDSVTALALSGMFSAAGFAAVENIKYVFKSSSDVAIGTSIWRGILAIPFHIACTTYASSRLGMVYLKHLSNLNVASDSNNASIEESSRITNLLSLPSLWEYVSCLIIPGILHGLYDSGLFLAAQMVRLQNEENSRFGNSMSMSSFFQFFIGARPWYITAVNDSHIHHHLEIPHQNSFTTPAPDNFGEASTYEIITLLCLFTSLASYVTSLGLSIATFIKLKTMETQTLLTASESGRTTINATTIDFQHQEQYTMMNHLRPLLPSENSNLA